MAVLFFTFYCYTCTRLVQIASRDVYKYARTVARRGTVHFSVARTSGQH